MSLEDVFRRLRKATSRIDQALGRLEEKRPLTSIGDAAAGEAARKTEHEALQWQRSRQAVRERLDTTIDRLEKILER